MYTYDLVSPLTSLTPHTLTPHTHRNVAAVVGSLVLLRFTLRFLCNACSWLRAYFLAPLGLGRTNLKKYGPWAGEWNNLSSITVLVDMMWLRAFVWLRCLCSFAQL